MIHYGDLKGSRRKKQMKKTEILRRIKCPGQQIMRYITASQFAKPYLSEKNRACETSSKCQVAVWKKHGAQAPNNTLITIPVSSKHNPNWLDTSHNTQS